jgi:hypothetical protein
VKAPAILVISINERQRLAYCIHMVFLSMCREPAKVDGLLLSTTCMVYAIASLRNADW